MDNKKKQALNPYLPLDICIADGEPHVFDGRVYVFGSHDRPGGQTFCELDYEVWSAPVNDLGNWKSHGIVYSAKQDPGFSERKPYLFAPDVVQGNDGNFYLYYQLGGWKGKHGYEGPISVAVSGEPGGRYEYLGYVQNPDGTPFRDFVTFDPGVINDDGTIRLYFGTSYFFDEYKHFPTKRLYQFIESRVFDRNYREIRKEKDGVTGACTVRLAEDMRTVVEKPVRILPVKAKGTSFEGHAFFEAASIRKFGKKYYFIYSSRNNHELCYAFSDEPDKGFVYGGTIISNGDIGFHNRKSKNRLALTGNNHGSIVQIGETYYIFYHRMTDKSTYSRQACAEEIKIDSNGKIQQVEMTSCGLNGSALAAEGDYPASIACVLTNGHMPHLTNGKIDKILPYITYRDGQTMIADISEQTTVGYRYFCFHGNEKVYIVLRGAFKGTVRISGETGGETVSEICLSTTDTFTRFTSTPLRLSGSHALYFTFHGSGNAEFLKIGFC